MLLLLRGASPILSLRHRGSGEVEQRALPVRHAAFYVGGALESVQWEQPANDAVLIACHAPMPASTKALMYN